MSVYRIDDPATWATHPYFGIPKMTIPAETGTIGSSAVIFATVWFQLFSHVSPRSGLNAKLRS